MRASNLVGALLLVLASHSHAMSPNTLDEVRERRLISVGVRDSSPPLSYLVDAVHVGYHIDLCQKILKRILPGVAIRYVPVTAQNRIPLLQNRAIDLECGSTTNTLSRQREVAFANTTYITEVRLAVKTRSNIASLDDLKGKTVVTTLGSSVIPLLRKFEKDHDTPINTVLAKDHADAFLLLASDRAEGFVMDDSTLAGNISNASKPSDYKIVGKALSVGPIALMLRKEDEEFKKAINTALSELMASGDLQHLYEKWFTRPIPPRGETLGLSFGAALRDAFLHPNDKPEELYNAVP